MRSAAKKTLDRGRAKSPTTLRRGKADESRARVRLDVEERRAQLVELGLAEFGTRTYDEVSIDLIAQSAGISKGLLYHYFPTKRAFYLACVRAAAARLIDRLVIVDDDNPLNRLHTGIDRYLEYVRAHGRAYATLMRGGVGIDREIASVVDETRSTLLNRLTSGMSVIFPKDALESPFLKIALHGWIGLAEAASITWVEECVDYEANPESKTKPPSSAQVRDLLANALVAIVQNVSSL